MDSRRVSRGGVGRSGRSDPSSLTPRRRVTRPLSKKDPVIALGGVDLQFLSLRPQRTENPEQRSRVVLHDSTSSSPYLEPCSTPAILSKQQTFDYRPQRESLTQAMPWLQPPASTPFLQRCSNFLDNILTTAEERAFLRGMMPETAFPSENCTMHPEIESGSEASKCMPEFVAPSQVEYNPYIVGVPDAPEDKFLAF